MAESDEVQGKLCDIDHRRPAVVRVTVIGAIATAEVGLSAT